MNQVERVVGALAARGREVSPEVVARELGGLEGLPPDVAADALLRTYGLAPDGTPLPGFESDRTSRQVVGDLLRESRSTMAYVFVAGLVGLVPAVVVPLLMRLFVDRYIVAQDTTWGATILLSLIVAGAIAAVVVILQYAVLERLTLRISRSGGVGFAWSTLTMRIPELQQYGAGDVIARRAALQRFAFQGGSLLPLALVNSLTAIVYVARDSRSI